MSNNNSTLIAMQELMKLEAERVQQLEDVAQAKRDAEQRAGEQAKQRARARAERIRAEQHAREQDEQRGRDQQQREERIRIAEAQACSRAEIEARLRQEQMRLDAQVEIAKRKTTPYWLYVTAGVLAVAMLGGGAYAHQAQLADATQTKRIAASLAERDREIDELEAKRAQLERDMDANLAKQVELRAAHDRAQSETERARLLAELDAENAKKSALAAKLAANNNNRRQRATGTNFGTTNSGRDKPLIIVGGEEPLTD